MKLFLFLSIMLAAGSAFAAIPSTSTEWYTPDEFSFSGANAKWSQSGKDYSAHIDRNGKISWYKYPNDKGVQKALEYALVAYANTNWNFERIETLGENLNKVFSTDGITITGETPDGSIGSYTIRFNSGIGDSNTIQAESNHMNWNLADEYSLHMKKGNKIEIMGWSSAYNNGSIFDMPGADLVCRTTAGLKYGKFGGIDKSSLNVDSKGKIAINGWNPNYSGKIPLVLANMGGVPNWIEMTQATGGCACTNKWESLLSYMTDGKNNSADLTFTYDSIDKMLKEKYGFVYSTSPADLHFAKEGEEITASFNAPGNWADGVSVEAKDGKYQIKDFADAAACSAELSTMLKNPTSSDAVNHYFLAKEKSTGNLHYVSIGKETLGGDMMIDDASIVTNSASRISIAGFDNADDGTILSKNGGSIAWVDAPKSISADGVTIAEKEGTDNNKVLSIKGFDSAANNSIPWKNANGELIWGGASTVTNIILAGAGINITDNGGGAITISAPEWKDPAASNVTTIEVITDIKYDASTHALMAKKQKYTVRGFEVGNTETWSTIFTATSHAAEHTGETGE